MPLSGTKEICVIFLNLFINEIMIEFLFVLIIAFAAMELQLKRRKLKDDSPNWDQLKNK